MPLKLNVGLSRKLGEAKFSSRGASVNLKLELDSASELIDELKNNTTKTGGRR